jgi:DNA polymerase III delta' subunit
LLNKGKSKKRSGKFAASSITIFMSLKDVIGQPLAVELAERWLARQTAHPFLFYGPDGVGKKTLALELAKALNCSTPAASGDACGACLSCRKIKGGLHPDVRVVDFAWQAAEREEAVEKQQTLRIETILNERHRLLQSPLEGRWKVSVIDDAHKLTPDAANVLLKILEEPPERTAIFLLTPYRDRLFATIVSRCQPVRFRRLSDEEMRQVLRRFEDQGDSPLGSGPSLMRIIELALGSPGRALHMSREDQLQGVLEAEALWQSLAGQPPSQIVSKADGRGKTRPTRADVEARIRCLLLPAARALRAGELRATRSVSLIEDALLKLRHNVQPGLVFEQLLLKLAAVQKVVQ